MFAPSKPQRRALLLEWHGACIHWVMHCGDLPAWAEGIAPTWPAVWALRRQSDARIMFGTGKGELRGFLHYIDGEASVRAR